MNRRSPDGHYPNGHFYSRVIDPAEVEAAANRIWPSQPEVRGVDFNHAGHQDLLRDVFPRYIGDYDYPATLPEAAEPLTFFDRNPAFAWLDSRALFVLPRHWRPRHVIEVGSGHSTLLMADVNRRFLGGGTEIRCIEPYPPAFLATLPAGIAELIASRVQDVPLETFDILAPGDVLFIDSSHVSKTGSDVNHLMFEVLPRLPAGVHIHFHDIFLPFDYPRDWVLKLGLYWNEQYMVRAMLTLTRGFRVTFYGGGSFWIEKIA
jgi:hypothetical protein